jgi:asparagine synthase (glutamine-hydrolysing)
MTAIAVVLSRAHRDVREETTRQMLVAMRGRGGEELRVRSRAGATLGVACAEWEGVVGSATAAAIAQDGDVIAVADATLYYRADLMRALRAAGVVPEAGTSAHLVLAAYRAWGEACAARIEGDFAFLVWDGASSRLIGARDFAAKRPLHYAELGDTFVVASTLAGVLAHADCDDALDVGYVAEVAAGLCSDDTATCRRAVRRVPAAHTLVRDVEQRPRIERHWRPPSFESGGRLSLEDGAETLRDLLASAVVERLDQASPTSIWLSGGWDSPAVFGAAMSATSGDAASRRIRPISISYPPGDPGREDGFIAAIADQWNVSPRWIDIGSIPLFDRPADRAAERDEPFAHAFEHWNRALARGSRSTEARVALEGNGGDQLFQVSLVYLADLMRRGRWLGLARECRARGVRDARTLFRWAVQPSLPPIALQAATAIRGGRRLRPYLERAIPDWIDARAVQRHGLEERARVVRTRAPGESHAAAESRWYLTAPYFPRVFACVSALARDEGVELRSPMYDARIIDFASRRPREERASRAETKRLLRAAMRGLLPAHVLAPRSRRTGTTGAFFERGMREHGPTLLTDIVSESQLAALGLVDPMALRAAWARWEQTRDANLGVALFLTMQTELWLRANAGVPRCSPSPARAPKPAPALTGARA